MYTVGRLGSYITRGVYTVSGPFHPFGGAVDIIVVEQPDGSFKSSPWYVRFGKFQGVLKTKEKVVSISVDGVQADFHMYLDHKGEAYFLREVDGEAEEGDSVLYRSSSGDETDGQQSGDKKQPMKSKSCNFDADQPNLVTQIDISNGKIVTRTRSSRILGRVFGRKSTREDRIREEEDGPGVVRADSLERAEIAADLLEVRWSTNLASTRYKKDNVSQFSAPANSGCEADMSSSTNDGQSQVDRRVLHEEIDIHDNGMGDSSWVGFPKLESSDEDCGVEMSCLNTKHTTGTSSFGESGSQESYDLNSQSVREVDELVVANADHEEKAKGSISEITSPDPDSAELDECPTKKLDEGHVSENGADRLEAFAYSETLESSRVGLDDSGGETDEALYVTCVGGAEVYVNAKMLHELAELISEVNSVEGTSLLIAKEPLDFPENLVDGNCSNFFSDAQISRNEGTSSNSSTANCMVTETFTQIVTVEQKNSVKEVESCSIYAVSGFENSISEVQDRETIRGEDNTRNLQDPSNPAGNSQEFKIESFSTEAITVSQSEEQLLFGDFDDFNQGEVTCMESNPSNHVEKENHPSVTSEYREAVIESLNTNDESRSSSDKFIQGNVPNDVEDVREKTIVVSSCINIPSSKVTGKDLRRMAESLPNMWSRTVDFVAEDELHHPLGHSLDANSESSKWKPLAEDLPSYMKSDTDKGDQVSPAQPTVEEGQLSEELKDGPANPAFGNPSEVINVSNGSWRVWPFKRSRSMKSIQPAQTLTRISTAENTLESSTSMDAEKDVSTPKVKRKKVRAITPTPEQLASLNLKEGKNTVTFTFSTSMLGPQKVDARIYLWKWDARVVISDVDGTITKSDVLGQFMPLVGMDWSQTGVAHLFSAIKENGYQLLFLSARAISQAYHTRQFLFNLKQDGKALPEGPVVISPDGLFPSLFREVIRRAPHEFKIACLEDIRALFPSDRNPFYAGFGNRDTDEFSYLKVGIPKGKIFIINPKGEVVVNRRVDAKSYTSLHALVHDMFPPVSSSEQQEDFNSWNFWKLPPPVIDA